MCIKLYNASRWVSIKNPTQKNVYTALASCTDDLGVAKIPIEAKKTGNKCLALITGFSPRAIHNALIELERQKLIIRFNSGPHGSVIHVVVPALDSGSKSNNPESSAGKHAPDSVNPFTSEKQKETAVRKRLQRRCGTDAIEALPNAVSLQLVEHFLELRTVKDAPNTPGSLNIIFEQIDRLVRNGSDVNEKLRQCIVNGWVSLEQIPSTKQQPRKRSSEMIGRHQVSLSDDAGGAAKEKRQGTCQGDGIGSLVGKVMSNIDDNSE